MNIVLDRTFPHAITERSDCGVQDYRMIVATEVVANLFGHSELLFETVYYMVSEDTEGYERTPEEQLYTQACHGYGMVTVFRVPSSYENLFRQRVGSLFQAMSDTPVDSNAETPLHHQQAGTVAVYMKTFGDELWAFVIDGATTYNAFEMLNPDSEAVDLSEMEQDEAELLCLTNHERVIRLWGDENSDNGFDYWISQVNKTLYHQLVRLNVIGEVDEDGESIDRADETDGENFE